MKYLPLKWEWNDLDEQLSADWYFFSSFRLEGIVCICPWLILHTRYWTHQPNILCTFFSAQARLVVAVIHSFWKKKNIFFTDYSLLYQHWLLTPLNWLVGAVIVPHLLQFGIFFPRGTTCISVDGFFFVRIFTLKLIFYIAGVLEPVIIMHTGHTACPAVPFPTNTPPDKPGIDLQSTECALLVYTDLVIPLQHFHWSQCNTKKMSKIASPESPMTIQLLLKKKIKYWFHLNNMEANHRDQNESFAEYRKGQRAKPSSSKLMFVF